MNNKKKRGFTLIELMITVGIVSLLSAVAIPSYQDYVARGQITESLSLATGSKVAIADYHSSTGKFPEFIEKQEGKFIEDYFINTVGSVVMIMGNQASEKIKGGVVWLVPHENDDTGNLSFTCESNIENKYLPEVCRYIESVSSPSNNYYMGNSSWLNNDFFFDAGWFEYQGQLINPVFHSNDFTIVYEPSNGFDRIGVGMNGSLYYSQDGKYYEVKENSSEIEEIEKPNAFTEYDNYINNN